MLVVDFRWNKIARDNSVFKKVNMLITSPVPVSLNEMTIELGLETLSKAFIYHSQTQQ